ncbi:hypothetical protein B1H58_03730 [Pantoea alhagi]|uniref:Uncharacterized protein n=1 Tax=Pantoea alhagi TaxID=1891675 RepID=A0A1W6B2A1_9GAMM|nr:hypothetical protein B1H58_03730 [Pantoea alhagi]
MPVLAITGQKDKIPPKTEAIPDKKTDCIQQTTAKNMLTCKKVDQMVKFSFINTTKIRKTHIKTNQNNFHSPNPHYSTKRKRAYRWPFKII